jgi:hypothetical protein
MLAVQDLPAHGETDTTTSEFLGYLRTQATTEELADQLRWVLERRRALARVEHRKAS